MTGPPWYNVSFSDDLGDQLPAITQACWLGTELALFANQLMAPDSINVASHTPPKLSPSPNDHCL